MNSNVRINFRKVYFMLCEKGHDPSGCTKFVRFLNRCVIINISSNVLYDGEYQSI